MNTSSHIILSNRESLSLSGVSKIISAIPKEVSVEIGESTLVIGGNNLEVKKLDLENSAVEVYGNIDSLKFQGKREKQSLLKRIFK